VCLRPSRYFLRIGREKKQNPDLFGTVECLDYILCVGRKRTAKHIDLFGRVECLD
jgi:hypothetical protein